MDRILLQLLDHFMRYPQEFVSGDHLGDHLGITRAAVSKRIQQLKSQGFEIESVTRKGHRMLSIPNNRLIPERIKLLSGNTDGLPVIYLPSVNSTNSYAKAVIEKMDHQSFLVITDDQNAGRGRYQRQWLSEPGRDIAMTLALYADRDVTAFFEFIVVISVTLYQVLSEYSDGFKIKWPNDLYYHDKKICGVLSEMLTEQNRITYLIIGIGMNVNSHRDRIPTGTGTTDQAVSLLDVTGSEIDRNELIGRFVRRIDENLKQYFQQAANEFYQIWINNLWRLGENITVKTMKDAYHGILKTVTPDGALVLIIDGREKIFHTGDILFNS